jgi:N-acetylneuraminic acid mutarotase
MRQTLVFLIVGVAALFLGATASASTAGYFNAPSPMHQGRGYFTATRLLNGNVLVAGGWGFDMQTTFPPPASLATSEIYHWRTGSWTQAAPMHDARAAASAVRLLSGRVLVAGGMDAAGNLLANAEIYSAKTNTWTTTGPLHTARFEDIPAVRLADGRVLVTGGFSNAAFPTPAVLASTEIWHPSTGKWIMGRSMHVARGEFATVVLRSGRILVMGGVDGSGTPLNSAEIYNPLTGRWKLIAAMHVARVDEAAVRLADGRVLVAGGSVAGGDRTTSCEIYNPATGKWRLTGSLNVARSEAEYAIVRLPGGRVLLAGGYTGKPDAQGNSQDVNTAEVYNPATGRWALVSTTMSSARSGHAAVLLPMRQGVLVMGGVNNGLATPTVDVFHY